MTFGVDTKQIITTMPYHYAAKKWPVSSCSVLLSEIDALSVNDPRNVLGLVDFSTGRKMKLEFAKRPSFLRSILPLVCQDTILGINVLCTYCAAGNQFTQPYLLCLAVLMGAHSV